MATDETSGHTHNDRHPSEQVAHDWHIEANRESQTRLNYWLLTEGLLLTAFAAAGEGALGEESPMIRLALSIGGVFFTLVWHSLMVRIWSWNDWYFRRARFLHKSVWGQPTKYDDATNLGAYPPDKMWTFVKGSGLGMKCGVHLLTAAFYLVWASMVWVAWKNMREVDPDLVSLDAILIGLTILGAVVVIWTAVFEIKDWRENRTK